MRSPTYLLAFALGLVPSLTVASKCGDNVAIERLPVYDSSDGPFIVRAQEGYNVFLKEKRGEHVLFISKKDDDLPEFNLKHGNFTTEDKKLAAVYGPVPRIYPIPWLPLVFTDEAEGKPGAEVVFVTKTRSDGSGRDVLRLFFLNGPPVVETLTEGAEIFVKPEGSIEPTVQLDLDVRRPPGYHQFHKQCAENQKYLNDWDLK